MQVAEPKLYNDYDPKVEGLKSPEETENKGGFLEPP